MFRINHLLRLSTLANKTLVRASVQQQARVSLGLQSVGVFNRFYSNDAGSQKPPGDHSKKKLPYLDECAKPDLTTECPQPQCPYEEDDKNPYRNAIILGLLLAAATLAALYAIGFFDKKDEQPKKKEKKKKKRQKRAIIKDPPTSADIPKEVPYLLIGGGTASFSAFRAIKSEDPTAKVLVITDESFHPYMRPPLSKEMWYNEDKESVRKLIFKQWNGSERNLYYEPEDFYIKCKNLLTNENGGVAVARGYTVSRLDVLEKVAYLDDGYAIHYDKCLIATGASPKTLPVFEAASTDPCVEERIKLFRNIYDFEDVFETFDESKSIAIVGGGFLGSELACALARKAKKSKKDIYQIFRETGNMGKVLPEYLSQWTTNKVVSEGVQVMSGTEVVGVKTDKKKAVLILNNGKTLKVDQVIVAVGVEPNTALAEQSDLEVDPELGGFLVNTELLARSDLYIAGDCACFYDAKLGRRRIEHHDHAVVTGRLAGENMTGKAKPYLHQSMFWSDLGPDVGYEAIGIIDSTLPTVAVFAKSPDKDSGDKKEAKKETVVTETDSKSDSSEKKKPSSKNEEDYNKGIIFYLRDDIVVGIVLWNVFNRMSIARQVLKDERKYEDLNEVAKLFSIHEE